MTTMVMDNTTETMVRWDRVFESCGYMHHLMGRESATTQTRSIGSGMVQGVRVELVLLRERHDIFEEDGPKAWFDWYLRTDKPLDKDSLSDEDKMVILDIAGTYPPVRARPGHIFITAPTARIVGKRIIVSQRMAGDW